MHTLLLILAILAAIGGAICSVIVTIDAFQSETWMGLLCIFGCGAYFAYYSIFEFEHENKWPIAIGALGGWSVAAGFFRLSQGIPL